MTPVAIGCTWICAWIVFWRSPKSTSFSPRAFRWASGQRRFGHLPFAQFGAHHLTQQNDTGFIYYFTRTGLCRTASIKPLRPEHVHEKARLTLDYPEDLAFFEALFMELYKERIVFGIDEIVSLLRRRPELLEINSMVDEEYWKRTHQLAQLEYRMDGKILKIGDV